MVDAAGILEIPSADLLAGTPAIARLERSGALALRVRGTLSNEACRVATAAVYAARASWVADFEASQFTVGRAFYTHLNSPLRWGAGSHLDHAARRKGVRPLANLVLTASYECVRQMRFASA